VEILLSQDALQAEIVGITWRSDFDPVWMASWHNFSAG
jgi:hypothetical protein